MLLNVDSALPILVLGPLHLNTFLCPLPLTPFHICGASEERWILRSAVKTITACVVTQRGPDTLSSGLLAPKSFTHHKKSELAFFFFFFLISSYDRFWSHFVWEVQQWCWREDHGVGISLGTTLEGRQEGSTAEDTLPLVGTDAMHTRAETSASSSVAWVCFSCRLCRANTHAWDDFWNPASCSKWDSWNQTRCCFQAFAVSQKVSQNNESFELLGPEAA